MKRIKLIVAYDGTKYCGWQIQPNEVTVEGVLNQALSQLTGEDIRIIGASRTDSGVHALGNVAVFDTQSTIPEDRFPHAVNKLLPEDIVVQKSVEVLQDFHPRHCDTVKTYEYRILNSSFPIPQERNFSWHVYQHLDIEKMKNAAKHLVGKHDFKSFCSVKTQTETTVRTIYSLEIIDDEADNGTKLAENGGTIRGSDGSGDSSYNRNTNSSKDCGIITVRIRGNGFLYNMVRIIVGTLVQIGSTKAEADKTKEMLESLDRVTSGPTAPPQGLTLVEIDYLQENLQN